MERKSVSAPTTAPAHAHAPAVQQSKPVTTEMREPVKTTA
jgi:hypothetical protein